MVYSEKWYIILCLFTKLIDNQYFMHFTTMYTMQDYILEFTKCRNHLILKNMQKNFSGSHPLRISSARTPLHPFVNI